MMNSARLLMALALAGMLFAPCVGAQTPSADPKPAEAKPAAESYQTLYLTNLTQQSELNDIQTDLRNMLPKARVYAIQSQNAISMRGTADDIQLAQKILAEFDRPRKVYRITYTITETDGGKTVGTEHYSLIATSGQRTVLKQGRRVPIVTGSSDADSPKSSTQVRYVDAGLSIEASADGVHDGVRLRTMVSQSSVAEEKPGVGAQDPVIRETTLDEITTLALGKPQMLGSLDLPGGTRKQEIEVVLDIVR
jgi:type II secretory pathway component GspD/PulD (secretin)